MAITTTRRTPAKPKPFAWSYSRFKNFETCPKRYYEVDVAKNFKEPESEALTWGNAVHEAMANRCGPKQTPLPKGMEIYEPWAQKVLVGGGDIETEQSMALTADFKACGFFDAGVWYRAKVDFIKRIGDVALVVDWKTGKILEDSVQLALTACCVFAKYPEIQGIRASFVWLKEDAESSETFYRADMAPLWRGLWPRIEALTEAHRTMTFPPLPGRLCRRWCHVTSCPHWQKG